MEKALAIALLLLFTSLTKHRSVNGQVFCRSQISLANAACSLRNFPGARAPPVPRQLNESSSSTIAAADCGGSRSGYELQSRDDDGDDNGNDEGRRRRHRRHSAERDPQNTACCRRLMAIDSSCVCQLVARLPVFLTSVWHVIKLRPVDGCDVSFECPGSFSPLGS